MTYKGATYLKISISKYVHLASVHRKQITLCQGRASIYLQKTGVKLTIGASKKRHTRLPHFRTKEGSGSGQKSSEELELDDLEDMDKTLHIKVHMLTAKLVNFREVLILMIIRHYFQSQSFTKNVSS